MDGKCYYTAQGQFVCATQEKKPIVEGFDIEPSEYNALIDKYDYKKTCYNCNPKATPPGSPMPAPNMDGRKYKMVQCSGCAKDVGDLKDSTQSYLKSYCYSDKDARIPTNKCNHKNMRVTFNAQLSDAPVNINGELKSARCHFLPTQFADEINCTTQARNLASASEARATKQETTHQESTFMS